MKKNEYKCPEDLREFGKTWWEANIPVVLEYKTTLSPADLLNLKNLANLYEFIKEAEEHLKTEGPVVEYANGIIGISKWQEIYTKNMKQYYILATEYGLMPLAQAKLKKLEQKSQNPDGLDESELKLEKMLRKSI